MTRFEYRVELIDKGNIVDSTAYVKQLNEYGQGGWEIISTEYAERKGKPMVSVLMKRSIPVSAIEFTAAPIMLVEAGNTTEGP